MLESQAVEDRASSPVVGVALVVALAVVLASSVAAALVVGVTPAAPAPSARLALTVDADADAIALQHRGGDAIDADDLRVVVSVDGTRLRHQPPVPFFAARGFQSGPTGPFNRGYDGAWTAGETASFALADTNHPGIDAGDRVTVRVYANDALVARLAVTTTPSTPKSHDDRLDHRHLEETQATSQASKNEQSAGQAFAPDSVTVSDSVSAASAAAPGSSPGTRASVVMAMSGSYDGPITRCVTSPNPASWNIRSASSSS